MEARIPTLDQVRGAAPAELAVALSSLDPAVVFGLHAESVEALVVATQKVASWCHGLQAMAVDRFAEITTDALEEHVRDLAAQRGLASGERLATPVPEPDAVAASSLAPLLNIAPRTMRTRLNRARALMELPATLDLALAGALEPWRVDGVVTAAADVAPDRLVEFEARLYAVDVLGLPKPRLVERARRAAVKADPGSTHRAQAAAPRRRSLRWAPSEVPGLMRWTLDVPDDTSRRLAGAVDALAQQYLEADRTASRSGGGDDGDGPSGSGVVRERRTVEAARLDALTDLALANADVQTLVEIVVPVTTAQTTVLVPRPEQADVIRAALTRPATVPPLAADADPPNADAPVAEAPGTDPPGADPPDPLLVDLVAGSVTVDTLACGDLERHLGMRYGLHLETAGNPFLTRRRPHPADPKGPSPGAALGVPTGVGQERVWFVDGLVQAPGATTLLPEHVIALLDHPDTRIRVTGGPVGTSTRQRRARRAHAALARRVRARDGHCRFPGCSVPAARCDLDHLVPHPAGETCEENLHALCRVHHGFKHHAGWTVRMDDDGTCHWTAPTGRTHTTHPATRQDTAA